MNIMFMGKMGSGKSTYANLLVDRLGFFPISLAQPIKEMEKNIDDLDYYGLVKLAAQHLKGYGDKFVEMANILEEAKQIPRESPKPRKRLQFIGTEGGIKRIDPAIWIKILLSKIKNSDKNWVCDDCRFKVEYDMLHTYFLPIKVTVDRSTQLQRLKKVYPNFDESVLEHSSEREIDSLPADISIDGTLPIETAYSQLLDIYDKFIYRS